MSARRIGTRVALVLASALTFTSPRDVRADDQQHAAALASFEEGLKRLEAQDYAGAAARFRESVTHEDNVGARINLADCEDKLGQSSAAWLDFRAGARLAADHADSRRALALDRAVVLERRLLVISFPALAGLAVSIDHAPVDGALVEAGSIAVDPGSHDITARADGYQPKTERVTGGAGDVYRLSLVAVPSASSATLQANGRGSGQRRVGIVVASVGAVGLVAGTVFGALTFVEHGNAVRQCQGAYPMCTNMDGAGQSAVRSANDRATTYGVVSDVTFAVGGIAAVAGVLIYFLAPSASASVRVGSGGASFRWTF